MNSALAVFLALAADVPAPAPSPTPSPAPIMATQAPTAPEALEYPLGAFAFPTARARGEPFTLTDLRYSLNDADAEKTAHAFAARVRYKDWGYLGAVSEGERRGLSLMTHRLALGAYAKENTWEFTGRFRAPRFVVSADALWRGSVVRSWLLEPSLSVLVLRDLEIGGWTVVDTGRPGERLVTQFGGDLAFQRGARLTARAGVARSFSLTVRGDENRTDSATLAVVGQLGRFELTSRVSLEDVTWRFPRRNTGALLRVRVPLAGRLLLEGNVDNRYDNGSGEVRHAYRGALAWYGRRITLPRTGRVAEHAVALARRATRTGEYEWNAFDEDALRSQRDRLSLSPNRESYREESAQVYRAEVEERLLPLLSVEYRDQGDSLTGEVIRTAHVTVGVPWPPTLPWRAREGSVPFLLLDYEHQWHTTATEYRSGANVFSLTIALNREMDLVARWSRSEATALDVIRGIAEHRRFEVSYVFARGR